MPQLYQARFFFFMSDPDSFAQPMEFGRDLLVACIVVLAHGGALWAVQRGLEHQPPEPPKVQVIAAELITAAVPIIEEVPPSLPEPPAPTPPKPPPPAPPPPVPPPPKPKPPKPKPPKKQPAPKPAPVPAPLPVADASPTAMSVPPAPAENVQPDPEPAPPPASSGPPGPPGPPSGTSGSGEPHVTLPSSKASYLNNPRPQYPPMSKRLGETGTVMLKVLVGADGTAKDVLIHKSSGFERLDVAALEAVRKWRFVPGTRLGVPEDMWFNVPVKWVLND